MKSEKSQNSVKSRKRIYSTRLESDIASIINAHEDKKAILISKSDRKTKSSRNGNSNPASAKKNAVPKFATFSTPAKSRKALGRESSTPKSNAM